MICKDLLIRRVWLNRNNSAAEACPKYRIRRSLSVVNCNLADIEQAREWLAQASAVAILTGAGISAESGVPTFRGDGGLWREYKPEELATPEAFERDPALVWEWYNWRREIIAKAAPNPAHRALVQLEKARSRDSL